jgi:hypothetical protein
MTVHDHRFTEPTPPFDLSGENDPDWDELWLGYLEWTEEFGDDETEGRSA